MVLKKKPDLDTEHLHTWFSDELESAPRPETGLILVTGATGYVGGRLVPELLRRKYKIRVMVRSYSPNYASRWPGAEIVQADALDPDALTKALEGVHTAYYLIHSLLLGTRKFESIDITAAENFRLSAKKQGIKRIIYLGALGDMTKKLSPHLKNRNKVATTLNDGEIPVIVLRAGLIIGSGSAPYEILKNLVKNTPIFFIPYWAKTKSQPIAIRDVMKYLIGIIETNETGPVEYDIGGNEILTYDRMLHILAKVQNKKRLFLPALFTNTAIYGYIASLLTPVPQPIIKALVRGCKNEVLCRDHKIREVVKFQPRTFKQALVTANIMEQNDDIRSRWSDSYPQAFELAVKLHQLKPPSKYNSTYCLQTFKEPKDIFNSFCRIGGKVGWFRSNWMWRMRGLIDRIFLGVGSSRGRRSYSELRVDDVIDFFRVENIKKDKLLLLRAEMILPGKAWLEFIIDSYEGLNKLTITAYFQPKGFLGAIYWYFFLPFHFYLFKALIKQIEKRS
jgi:uncharacterized protein YbjT (DUF2867 family)